MKTLRSRSRYEGALQILQFNSDKYIAAFASILAGAFVAPLMPPSGRLLLWIAVTPALFWMVSSLAVSHYVYDRFPIYDFRQVAQLLTRAPQRWINIHSGWDETSEHFGELFPESRGQVVDIFDAELMTERSIRRAHRKPHDAFPSIPARYNALPFCSHSFDAAFSIFAAHELRSHQQRVVLFEETARVLSPNGELVLMEHLRDWRNFLAFGPGFLHFFSRQAWRNAALEAGFNFQAELSMTPFVRVYILRRNS